MPTGQSPQSITNPFVGCRIPAGRQRTLATVTGANFRSIRGATKEHLALEQQTQQALALLGPAHRKKLAAETLEPECPPFGHRFEGHLVPTQGDLQARTVF